jgi:hypothetical protein
MHRKIYHGHAYQVHDMTLKCEVCENVFSSMSSLKRPTIEHCNEEKKVFVLGCDNCETSFIRDHDLKRHKQRSLNADGSSKFICTLCDERACNYKLLMGHAHVCFQGKPHGEVIPAVPYMSGFIFRNVVFFCVVYPQLF